MVSLPLGLRKAEISGNQRHPRGWQESQRYIEDSSNGLRALMLVGGPPQNAVPTQERETPGADGIREVRSEKPHPGSGEPQEHYRAD